VLVDAACHCIACWLRSALGLSSCCRAILADEGRGWSLGAWVSARLAGTSAWMLVALGSAVVDWRGAGEVIFD
jgi:hypothetical protein